MRRESSTITVDPAPLRVTSASLPNAIAGLPYGAQAINATGGYPPYQFALTQGTLPVPLTFTNGQVNGGVPTAVGPSSFTVTVTDSTGNTASGAFTLQVEATQPDLILSQASVSFAIIAGQTTLPTAANVTVGSSVASSLGYNVQVNPAASWLDVTPAGTTPGAVVIGLDPVNTPPLGAEHVSNDSNDRVSAVHVRVSAAYGGRDAGGNGARAAAFGGDSVVIVLSRGEQLADHGTAVESAEHGRRNDHRAVGDGAGCVGDVRGRHDTRDAGSRAIKRSGSDCRIRRSCRGQAITRAPSR